MSASLTHWLRVPTAGVPTWALAAAAASTLTAAILLLLGSARWRRDGARRKRADKLGARWVLFEGAFSFHEGDQHLMELFFLFLVQEQLLDFLCKR
jgi:hypothetical protein